MRVKFGQRTGWLATVTLCGIALAGCESSRFTGRNPVTSARATTPDPGFDVTPSVPSGSVTSQPLAPLTGAGSVPTMPGGPAAGRDAGLGPASDRDGAHGRHVAIRLRGSLDGARGVRHELPRHAIEHAVARPLPRICRRLREQGPLARHGMGFPGRRGLPVPAGRRGRGPASRAGRQPFGRPVQVRRADHAQPGLTVAARGWRLSF